MAPRTYTLGKRTMLVRQTRERILDAASVLFREQGIRATSMHDVAREADVAPATVLNHFPTAESLAEAVLDRIAETLRVPTAQVFAGVTEPAARLERLVLAMFEFYDRSNQWFAMYQRERDAVPAMRRAEARFWESVKQVYAEALGPLQVDEQLGPAALGITTPGTLGTLRAAGMSVEGAAALISRLLTHLVAERTWDGGAHETGISPVVPVRTPAVGHRPTRRAGRVG